MAVGRERSRGAFSLVLFELLFAQTDSLGRHFDELVVLDELQRLLQRVRTCGESRCSRRCRRRGCW